MLINKKTNKLPRESHGLLPQRGFLLERRGCATCYSRSRKGNRHRRPLYSCMTNCALVGFFGHAVTNHCGNGDQSRWSRHGTSFGIRKHSQEAVRTPAQPKQKCYLMIYLFLSDIGKISKLK
ncbi:hypothetical protein Y032_0052g2233 [Ancylostoma ceylanicum]|uniref:Uncharacterized protein n=1 Tax=Ancylostoma ceylanicum TaxID=53326 RepID=A0A016U881_9BILA|nr:hypothetical protein Y032_0052g2233 [Ancylostoma ceylanicum]